jgi:hypothetical protein
MNNYNDIILKYRSGEMSVAEKEEFNGFFRLNIQLRKEFMFQDKLDNAMRKSLLLKIIENDPGLLTTELRAREDIDNYLKNGGRERIRNSDFNIFSIENEVDVLKKIAKAEVEMVLAGIDDISEIWVSNFRERQPYILSDTEAQRIMKYVKESFIFDETAIQAPKGGLRTTRKISFGLAAAALVFSFLVFKSVTPYYSGDFVYKNFYEPIEANSFTLRGNSQDANGKLQEGFDYYLSKDYAKAEIAFSNLRNMNENRPEILLFSGLNQMEQQNYQAAIGLFNDLLLSEDQFIPEAQWYLGLCYIRTGDNLKARSIMETLSDTEGLYKKKAQQILKKLNRLV